MDRCQRCCATVGTAKQFERDRCDAERSKLDPSVCVRCHAYLVNLHENVRRVEAWGQDSTARRRIAELLVQRSDEIESRESYRADHRRWVALWEFGHDRAALRKVVERRIMRRYRGQLAFADPAVKKDSAEVAQS